MESSTVAALVEALNTALIIALAVFVFFGASAIFLRKVFARSPAPRRRSGGNKKADPSPAPSKPQGARYALLSAFCVAVAAAFAVEATVFNFQHYMKIFAGPELYTLEASPDKPNVVMLSNGASAEVVEEKDEKQNGVIGVVFKGIDMKITSVFAEIKFVDTEAMGMIVEWTDGLSNSNRFTKKLLKRVPRDNYTPLQPYGNVTELRVMFTMGGTDGNIEIERIALNMQIPFYFSGLRLVAVSFLFFAIFCFLLKGPRARAAYYLFELKFNPADKKQNAAYVFLVILSILFAYLCVNTSYPKKYLDNPTHQQYNRYLVDALMQGRTWLDHGSPENLLKAERPYDNAYRIANGYKFGADVMWDWAWYKGKFYCYYGVVPAVVLFLPYRLVTGEYLSNNGGIFAFAAAIIVLIAALWRFCVKRYMPNAGFAFYLLSYLALFFTSGLFCQLRFTRFYSISQTSGLAFALAGALLLLQSVENEKVNRLKIFFACLCLALVAGCRPNMIFVSLLVPIVLWKHRSRKLLLSAALPYLIVAVPLCAYNYVRFDSVFEFGINYTLGAYNSGGAGLTVPFGRIIKVFTSFVCYLFAPGVYSLYFPFVSACPLTDVYVMGMYSLTQPGVGMINFPIALCLPYLFRRVRSPAGEKAQWPPGRRVLRGFVGIAAATAVCDSLMVGFQGRYLLDFAFFAILPSLFCAYWWCAACGNRNRLGVVYVLLAVSVFVGLFLCVSGGFVDGIAGKLFFDPTLYRYLEQSLGVLRNV